MHDPTGHSYLRFSSKKQKKGDSTRRQTEDTVAGESAASWCARKRVRLSADNYQDMGLSAWTGANLDKGNAKRKPADLARFLEAIERGIVRPGDYLLVEKLDRISRQGVDEGMDVIKKILRAGVTIVTLMNGREYDKECLKGLMKGLLELQIALEQAKEFSDTLSKRVRSAWEGKRKKARSEKRTLATAAMPPWLRPVGSGDDRHALVVPERAETVRLIFRQAVAGWGITRIVRRLLDRDNPVPTITRRGKWSRSSVRRILTDRSVLGEYQPMVGRGSNRKPDGPPVEGYFDAIIDAATFHQAQACLGSRKVKNVGRDSKLFNLFSGLLKDARTTPPDGNQVEAKSYITVLRIEKGDKRHHVLQSAAKIGGACSFPYTIFETTVLELLREIDPTDILPPAPGGDRVLELSAELADIEARIGRYEAERATCEADEEASLRRTIRACLDRKKQVAGKLADAKRETDSPLAESWGECKTLLEAIDASPDRDAAMLRLRGVLRRVIESVWLLVVPRGRDRICAAQFWFTGGEHAGRQRSYIIIHRPPMANASKRVEGGTRRRSFKEMALPGGLDLRRPDHAQDLARVLENVGKADLDRLFAAADAGVGTPEQKPS
jgi:DNA invertase Pin-like site-specific DNA recombinase